MDEDTVELSSGWFDPTVEPKKERVEQTVGKIAGASYREEADGNDVRYVVHVPRAMKIDAMKELTIETGMFWAAKES